MNEAEIYLLANNLTLYNELQALGLLENVTEIMQNFIEGEKESYELGIAALQENVKDAEELTSIWYTRVQSQNRLIEMQQNSIESVRNQIITLSK